VLTNEAATFDKWRLAPGEAVGDELRARPCESTTRSAPSRPFAGSRLAPGLLETLANNKQYDLPQHVFEVGGRVFRGFRGRDRAREERTLRRR